MRFRGRTALNIRQLGQGAGDPPNKLWVGNSDGRFAGDDYVVHSCLEANISNCMTQPTFDAVASHSVPDTFGNNQAEPWWARLPGGLNQNNATDLFPIAFFQYPGEIAGGTK